MNVNRFKNSFGEFSRGSGLSWRRSDNDGFLVGGINESDEGIIKKIETFLIDEGVKAGKAVAILEATKLAILDDALSTHLDSLLQA